MKDPAGPATSPIELPPRIGHYEIKSLLGRGGMGDVYLAIHPMLGKRAAVKVLKVELCRIPEQVARFQQEAMAVCRIGHPAIVDVFDFGTLPDGRVYYLMEYLEGQNLADLLAARGPLSPFEAIDILSPVAEGLQAAHNLGIVHRDVKPENIFVKNVQERRLVKILDFGIAKLLDSKESLLASATKTGLILGTPAYMAPEQAAGKNDDISPATDVYALGIVFYQMVTGRPPFAGESQIEVLMQHLKTPAPSVTIPGEPLMAQALDSVLEKALAKEPSNRYQSMSEFIGALTRAVQLGPSVQARHPSTDVPSPSSRRQWGLPTARPPGQASTPATEKENWPGTQPGAAPTPIQKSATGPGESLSTIGGQSDSDPAYLATLASRPGIEAQRASLSTSAVQTAEPGKDALPRWTRRFLVAAGLALLLIGAVVTATVISVRMVRSTGNDAGQDKEKRPGPGPLPTLSRPGVVQTKGSLPASGTKASLEGSAHGTESRPMGRRATHRPLQPTKEIQRPRQTGERGLLQRNERTATRISGRARKDRQRAAPTTVISQRQRTQGTRTQGTRTHPGTSFRGTAGKNLGGSKPGAASLSFSELAAFQKPKKMTKFDWIRRQEILVHLADRAARTGHHRKAARWYFACATEYHNTACLLGALSSACRVHDKVIAGRAWRRIKKFFTADELSRQVSICKQNGITFK